MKRKERSPINGWVLVQEEKLQRLATFAENRGYGFVKVEPSTSEGIIKVHFCFKTRDEQNSVLDFVNKLKKDLDKQEIPPHEEKEKEE